MKNLQLKGCGTALLTPFKDGKVDYDCFARTVDRQVEAGIHFLVPLGTTGETPTLDDGEKVKLLQIAKAHCAGRPLLVGCGSNSLAGTLHNIRLLEPHGADAFLVVVPFYNKPTQQGMYEYFKAVAESTDKPVVIYNVPGRTGSNMLAETTLRLAADVDNIVAIKEASGNYSQVSTVIANRPEGFSVLSGDDEATLSFMATGAQGVISVASNIAPAQMVALVEALAADDFAAARKIHYSLMPLFKACFVESNPIPAKAAMSILGLMENSLRLPLVKCTEKTEALMADVLKKLDI